MPLDAICLRAVAWELSVMLDGARVDKINMPERDEVVLAVRGSGGTGKLILSCNPSRARVHMTALGRENPEKPPAFCMLLRKHLSNGRIRAVDIPAELGRVVRIQVEAADEMGDRTVKLLICEIMGRHSNIILVGSDGRILDCIRKVDSDMSAARQVLPGLFYRMPPMQESKTSLLSADAEMLRLLIQDAPPEKEVSAMLMDAFFGLSPLVARELSFLASQDASVTVAHMSEYQRDKLIFAIRRLQEMVKENNFTPTILLDAKSGVPKDFSFTQLHQYGTRYVTKELQGFGELLDECFVRKEEKARLERRTGEIYRHIVRLNERVRRKLELQRKELGDTAGRERVRELGDILTSFMHLLEKGMSRVTLPDFYAGADETVEITLDIRLTPQQNVQKYYKEYNRKKAAERYLSEQIALGERELVYLESVLDELSRAESDADVADIKEELVGAGLLSGAKDKDKRRKLKSSAFLEYEVSGGYRVYVGRNNRQNDELTMREASKNNFWFHTKIIPGSHTILDCGAEEPPAEAFSDAAMLAALHSQARDSEQIPVDYARVRNVKKPPGSRPVMVTYDRYFTAYVTPDKARAEKMKVRKS